MEPKGTKKNMALPNLSRQSCVDSAKQLRFRLGTEPQNLTEEHPTATIQTLREQVDAPWPESARKGWRCFSFLALFVQKMLETVVFWLFRPSTSGLLMFTCRLCQVGHVFNPSVESACGEKTLVVLFGVCLLLAPIIPFRSFDLQPLNISLIFLTTQIER